MCVYDVYSTCMLAIQIIDAPLIQTIQQPQSIDHVANSLLHAVIIIFETHVGHTLKSKTAMRNVDRYPYHNLIINWVGISQGF